MALTKATYSMIVGAAVNVLDYGAVGDGVTDDLAAFNLAKAAAVATNRAIYIPSPKEFKKYYKLSAAWVLDTPSLSVFGDGTSSCVVSHSATGDDAIRVTADHISIRDIGISGISTSGNGLHINLAALGGSCRFEGLWIGWMGIDGVRITSGQSNIFTDCSVDQNSAYRPITLTSGTEGNTLIAFNILSSSTANTNNNSFVNCRANAGGSQYNLKWGDSTGGNPRLETCNWIGGLIQGSSNYREVFFVNCQDCNIQSTHIEPPVGSTSNYAVTMQGCINCVISNGNIQGDSRFLTCNFCGLRSIRAYGISIDSTSINCFFNDMNYENNNTGPLGGKINDSGVETIFRNLQNASTARYAYGDNLPTKHQYVSNNMQFWVGGASPTVPCGFVKYSTPTVAQETTIKKSFDYSCKITSAGGLQGIRTRIGPVNYLQGKRILVQAWVYNSSNGLGAVAMEVDGALYIQASTNNNVWEKMLVTFDVPTSAATSVDLLFLAQDTGTVYFDAIAIWVEGDYQQVTEATLDGTATPSVSYPTAGVGGYPVSTLRTSGTPTITNFVDPHVGVPFTLLFDGATVVQDNAVIQLSGGANFTGTTNDTLTLVYGTDGIFREISRSVN